MKKLAIALTALALFAYGVLVGRYQTFPFRFISDTAMWATGNKGFDYYSDRKTLIETSQRTAAVVMLCAAFPGCEFFDLTATILPTRHTTDGLHLSTLGCQSW